MKKKYAAMLLAGILTFGLPVSGYEAGASAGEAAASEGESTAGEAASPEGEGAAGEAASPESEISAGDAETDNAARYDLYGNLEEDGGEAGDPDILRDAVADGSVTVCELTYAQESGGYGLIGETGNERLVLPDLTASGSGTASSRRIRRAAAALPSSYMTTYDDLPKAQNQSVYGLCWAYATVDAVRISRQHLGYISGTEDNYSAPFGAYATFYAGAEHTPFLTAGIPWYNQGGNILLMTGSMLSWHGPVYASDYPMNEHASYTEEELSQSVTHVTGFREIGHLYLCDRDSEEWQTWLTKLKTMIRDYGALAFGYQARYLKNNTLYNESGSANHANTLIGWDDEKETEAEKPGAFLFRNTWGTGYGDRGYAWISYYDATISDVAAYITESTPDGEHEDTELYSYNDSNYHSWLSGTTTSAWYANLFTADQDVIIDRIGFYVPAGGQTTVEIRTGCPKNRPGGGTLSATVTESSDVFGFFSVELDEPIELNQGKRFSLTAYTTDQDGNATPFFEGYSGQSDEASTAGAGESFLSFDGGKFTDVQNLTDYSYLNNACLNAYGNAADASPTAAPEITPTPEATATPKAEPTSTPIPTSVPEVPRYDEIDLDGNL